MYVITGVLMATKEIATGQKFGRLTVVGKAPSKGNGARLWCLCSCGVTKDCAAGNLRAGKTQSCGCLANELSAQRLRGNSYTRKHGHTAIVGWTPTYMTWVAMRARCHNPNSHKYPRYGGRGITVCERWNDFSAFLADVGERPAGRTLDRIDNDGNYEPGNVRWATPKEQRANQSA